jgi:choline dehydrogenase-like flavoprotein
MNVLIVEEGPDATDWSAPLHSSLAVESLFRNGGITPFHGSPALAFVEGRCVGGSTEINSAFWHRPTSEAIALWSKKYGLSGLDSTRANEIADVLEHKLDVNIPSLSPIEKQDPLKIGAESLGWNPQLVKRTQSSASAETPYASGAKNSMTRTLIPEAVGHGAKIISGLKILRLEIKNGVGVEALGILTKHGVRQRVKISFKYVFVCAGPVHSPSLLRRSGLRKNIGNSIRCHPMGKIVAHGLPEYDRHLNPLPGWQVLRPKIGITLGGSVLTQGYLAMALSGSLNGVQSVQPYFRTSAIYYAAVKAQGTGTVRVLPYLGDTIVRYEITDEDSHNLSDGLKDLGSALLHGGATSVRLDAGSSRMGEEMTDPSQFKWSANSVRDLNLTTVHAFGSCPIGDNRELTAADSSGRVHDTANVFIADASTIPESPGVNPQGSVMVLASKIAQEFAAAGP